MKRVIRLATTGYYDGAPYETDPYASLAIGRSLAGGLLRSRESSRLLARLEAVDDDDLRPLTFLGGPYRGGAGRLVALLENRDPGRFEGLYLRLPAEVRKAVAALSPIDHAVPKPSVADVADLLRFDGFVVRYLRLARG